MLRTILAILFFYFGAAYAGTNKVYLISEVINNTSIAGKKIYVSGFYFSDAIFKDKKSAHALNHGYLMVSLNQDRIDLFYQNCSDHKVVIRGDFIITSKGDPMLTNIDGFWTDNAIKVNCLEYVSDQD